MALPLRFCQEGAPEVTRLASQKVEVRNWNDDPGIRIWSPHRLPQISRRADEVLQWPKVADGVYRAVDITGILAKTLDIGPLLACPDTRAFS